MKWLVMTVLLVAGWGGFAYSAWQRWRLMRSARRPEKRWDRLGDRFRSVLVYMFGQKRMVRYPAAGWAHVAVFFGFLVLLLNTLILWGRAYDPEFVFWVFGHDQPLGKAYALLRDVFTVLVIGGVLVFYWNRLALQLSRLTLNFEGLLILTIIFVMMIADLLYEGGGLVRRWRSGEQPSVVTWGMPFASLTALWMRGWPEGLCRLAEQSGYWVHATLVLAFLNLLPYGKHFHVVTVLPNVFFRQLKPSGWLEPIQDIDGRLERGEVLGVRELRDLSWKSVLDMYTCTECGRCSDQCPATRTGKRLSPKHLMIGLRDHLYRRGPQWLRAGEDPAPHEQDKLVPQVVPAEVVWACTTCGACEHECPVFITYIDKIIDLRRNLVMEQGEFPEQLQTTFRGLETVGNPYSFANEQRADWAAGLDVPLRADRPDAEWLFWVGCACSFDDRAKKIARATAELLLEAGVDFAILGPEEQCTGDPARRAGNEYLFAMLAQANVETLNRYGVKRIVTACPHCLHTLRNEYPDFGGQFQVVHHSVLLAELVRTGRLLPRYAVPGAAVYHDACYLGRHNGIFQAPRELLRHIAALKVVEAAQRRDRAMCCGAGGAQMWKEEEHGTGRVNHARVRQLLAGLPASGLRRMIATACPFCMTMLTDGCKDQGHDDVQQLDVAELLYRAVLGERVGAVTERV
jgi:Fe-S oxidoreductase